MKNEKVKITTPILLYSVESKKEQAPDELALIFNGIVRCVR